MDLFYRRILFAFVFIRPVGARRVLFSSIVLLVLDGTIFLSQSNFFFYVFIRPVGA